MFTLSLGQSDPAEQHEMDADQQVIARLERERIEAAQTSFVLPDLWSAILRSTTAKEIDENVNG